MLCWKKHGTWNNKFGIQITVLPLAVLTKIPLLPIISGFFIKSKFINIIRLDIQLNDIIHAIQMSSNYIKSAYQMKVAQ